MEELKSFWVSYDYDGKVQFWKNRPVYNEGSDEFEGESLELEKSLANYLLEEIPGKMEFEYSEKFYIATDSFFGLTDVEHLDREEALYALSWDFRRIVNSIGRVEQGNRHFSFTSPVVLDISDLNVAVIKDYEGGVPVCDGFIRRIAVEDCLDNNIQEGDIYYGEPGFPTVDWTEEELAEFMAEEGNSFMLTRKKSIKEDELAEETYECYSAICEFDYEYFDRRIRYNEIQNIASIADDNNTDDIQGLVDLRNWLWKHILFCDRFVEDLEG